MYVDLEDRDLSSMTVSGRTREWYAQESGAQKPQGDAVEDVVACCREC
jgi:hypothetical protein